MAPLVDVVARATAWVPDAAGVSTENAQIIIEIRFGRALTATTSLCCSFG
jgi:hypothetical protein